MTWVNIDPEKQKDESEAIKKIIETEIEEDIKVDPSDTGDNIVNVDFDLDVNIEINTP